MPPNTPANVDEYLDRVTSACARKALSQLRAVIRRAAPEAEETISYGIPTYKLNGYLASFAAYKKHCSFFPGHTVRDFSAELAGYKVLKGTVKFKHDRPLPEELVTAMIRARAEENLKG